MPTRVTEWAHSAPQRSQNIFLISVRIYDPYPLCHYWGAEPTDTPSGDDYHIVVRPDKLQRSPEPREVPAVNTGIDFLVALARIVHMERGPLNEIRTLQLFEDFLNFLAGACSFV